MRTPYSRYKVALNRDKIYPLQFCRSYLPHLIIRIGIVKNKKEDVPLHPLFSKSYSLLEETKFLTYL